ncbi:hypothetical protein SLA2020_468670 [Shorea laevis]
MRYVILMPTNAIFVSSLGISPSLRHWWSSFDGSDSATGIHEILPSFSLMVHLPQDEVIAGSMRLTTGFFACLWYSGRALESHVRL